MVETQVFIGPHSTDERKASELTRQSEQLKTALLASLGHDLRTPLTAIRVPDGVDGKAVQKAMLDDGIEVGGGLGPDAPAIWRVGLMGPNANAETADRVFEALDAAVTSQGAPVPARG